jgi:hypothetical protein
VCEDFLFSKKKTNKQTNRDSYIKKKKEINAKEEK